MKNFTQIDLFGLSVFVENHEGTQIIYTIESTEHAKYNCYVMSRKSSRSAWTKKRLIESGNTVLKFEYAENDMGFRMKKEFSLQDKQ